MSFGGILFQLYWFGSICPCLEKEEDKTARHALKHINAAAGRITWMTGTVSSPSRRASATRFIGSLFGSKTDNMDDGNSSHSGGSGSIGGRETDVPAKLVLRDNADGEPEVFVDPLPRQQQQQQQEDGEQQQQQQQPSVGYKLNIALRRVNKVTLDGNAIVLLARPPATTNAKNAPPPAKELLRFVALNMTDPAVLPVTEDVRNLIVHHFAVLIEWERQRRRQAGFDEDEDADEDDQPNFLIARAQKAAHFANRELELQTTKREREKRKAKLVAESGGLKYTALAMANRSDD